MTAEEFDESLGMFLGHWKAVGMRNIAVFARRFCEWFRWTDMPRDPRWIAYTLECLTDTW